MIDWNGCLETIQPGEIAGTVLRLVESQEQVATCHLVSSLEGQSALEEMLDETKPPLRRYSENLDYLLFTPFRYPPLKYGSRFGARNEPSLFYGSMDIQTVLAESAYYRFVFWYGMRIPPQGKLDTQHTLFEAEYRTERGYKLQAPPFDAYRTELTHPSDYSSSQNLGSIMRGREIEAFEFYSARDLKNGVNVALFESAAFARNRPTFQEPWLCELTAEKVVYQATRGRRMYIYPLETFLVDDALPQPA